MSSASSRNGESHLAAGQGQLDAFNRYSTNSLAPSVAECVDRDLESFFSPLMGELSRVVSTLRGCPTRDVRHRHQVDSAHSARIGKCATVSDLSTP